jgi:hypothetical protein
MKTGVLISRTHYGHICMCIDCRRVNVLYQSAGTVNADGVPWLKTNKNVVQTLVVMYIDPID